MICSARLSSECRLPSQQCDRNNRHFSSGISSEPSARKNANLVHEQIWKQCLGEIVDAVPETIVEPIELGFKVPFHVYDAGTAKKKLEVDIKRRLKESVDASLSRQKVIKLFTSLVSSIFLSTLTSLCFRCQKYP